MKKKFKKSKKNIEIGRFRTRVIMKAFHEGFQPILAHGNWIYSCYVARETTNGKVVDSKFIYRHTDTEGAGRSAVFVFHIKVDDTVKNVDSDGHLNSSRIIKVLTLIVKIHLYTVKLEYTFQVINSEIISNVLAFGSWLYFSGVLFNLIYKIS